LVLKRGKRKKKGKGVHDVLGLCTDHATRKKGGKGTQIPSSPSLPFISGKKKRKKIHRARIGNLHVERTRGGKKKKEEQRLY